MQESEVDGVGAKLSSGNAGFQPAAETTPHTSVSVPKQKEGNFDRLQRDKKLLKVCCSACVRVIA
jgi:hypothetical protein